ncbi:MAG: DUF4364 family protein [Clostridiales bacterium]|nr:DUF4364 family protein [Clostridiales bacterium]
MEQRKKEADLPICDPMTCKLIILFTLEKMEFPLTENTIFDIIYYRNNWMSYMDCKDYLYKLVDSNLVYKTENYDSEERFNITYDGRNCLNHFYSKIPLSLREHITEYTRANRMHFKRSQEYVSTFFKSEDGSYIVVLKIRSDTLQNEPIFEIKIKAPSRQSAIEACKKWQEQAHNAFESIYELLIEEN